MDKARLERKILSQAHQEYNTPEFLAALDADRCIRERKDLYGREGFIWDVVGTEDLPKWMQANLHRFRDFVWVEDNRLGGKRLSEIEPNVVGK